MENKYGAVKFRGYDSKKEARRGDELRLLERAGKIRELREQVKFLLIPSQYQAPDGLLLSEMVLTGLRGPEQDVVWRKGWAHPHRIRKDGMWCVERACSYVADFVYVDAETGKTVVEDVKSPATRTPEYRIKRKLMLWIYGIRIKEV